MAVAPARSRYSKRASDSPRLALAPSKSPHLTGFTSHPSLSLPPYLAAVCIVSAAYFHLRRGQGEDKVNNDDQNKTKTKDGSKHQRPSNALCIFRSRRHLGVPRGRCGSHHDQTPNGGFVLQGKVSSSHA